MPEKTIGIIGLGLMGSALAERSLKSGFHVVGFDIKPDRREALRRMGGEPAQSALDAATRCRRIVLSLMTTAIVERVLDELRPKLRRGSVIIDTSTGDPGEAATIGRQLARRGIRYLDATVAGNSAETRAGKVLALVGGDAAAFRQNRDFFDCFARRTFHLGPCGSGARMKLVFNLVLGLNRAVLAEALAFAESLSIPPKLALEVLRNGTSYSHVMDNKGGKMLARDFTPQAKLSQHLKDVRLILLTAKTTGAKTPLSTLHRRLLQNLVKAGLGDLDNSAILKAFER